MQEKAGSLLDAGRNTVFHSDVISHRAITGLQWLSRYRPHIRYTRRHKRHGLCRISYPDFYKDLKAWKAIKWELSPRKKDWQEHAFLNLGFIIQNTFLAMFQMCEKL